MKLPILPHGAFNRAGLRSKLSSTLSLLVLAAASASAADGTWISQLNGTWSNTANWAGGVIADGAGSTADLSLVNSSTTVQIAVDTTSRTLGILRFGDTDASNAINVTSTGGGSLIFDNLGSTAILENVANASNSAIAAPMLLADSLNLQNNKTTSGRTLEIRAAVSAYTSGTKSLILTGISTALTTVTSTSLISDGAGVMAVVQESATSEFQLTGTNAHTYSGGTIIRNGGSLAALNNGSLGADIGAVTFDNGILKFSSANTVTTLLREGILEVGGGRVETATTSTVTWSGVLSGSGGLTKGGSNTSTSVLLLTGSNTYTGGTTVDAGVLRVSSDANLGALEGAVTLNGGQVNISDAPANSVFNRELILTGITGLLTVSGGNSFSAGWDGVISGSGMLRKQFAATLVLGGSNTYTGGTSLEGGTIRISNDFNLGAPESNVIFAGATTSALRFSQSLTSERSVQLNQNGAFTVDSGMTAIWNGAISGTGTLIKRSSGILTLTATNTFQGGASIEGGELGISADENLGQSGVALTFNNGSSTGLLATNVSLSSNRDIVINSVSARFGTRGDDNVTIWNGQISGSGQLDKRFVGTLVLTRDNIYQGGTVVNTGVLLANNTVGSATGMGSVTVNATLGGNGFIAADSGQSVTVNGVLLGGNGIAAEGILSIAGDVLMADGSVLAFAVGDAGAHSAIARLSGNWTFDADQTVNFLDFGLSTGLYQNLITGLDSDPGVAGWVVGNAGWTGTFSYDAGNVSFALAAIPEPGTLALLGLGLVGVLFRRRIFKS